MPIANYQPVFITDYILLIIIDYVYMWLTVPSVDYIYIHMDL